MTSTTQTDRLYSIYLNQDWVELGPEENCYGLGQHICTLTNYQAARRVAQDLANRRSIRLIDYVDQPGGAKHFYR